MIIEFVIPALLTIITASTPLVFAAIGEIVVEKSGVLNLGVEGMMIVGAVGAFAVTVKTGNPYIGVIAGAFSGLLLSFIFGFLTLYLYSNQVATGLALTIFGVGLSALLGHEFVRKLNHEFSLLKDLSSFFLLHVYYHLAHRNFPKFYRLVYNRKNPNPKHKHNDYDHKKEQLL